MKLFRPVDGQKQLKGILEGFDNNCITIMSNKKMEIDRKNISQIKTVYNW